MGLAITQIITVMTGLLLVFFIHELGHYLIGRIFKLKIAEFSIGIGPVKFLPRFLDKNGTVWRLGLFPVGGYVRPLQRPEEDSGPVNTVVSKVEEGFSNILEKLLQPFSILWSLIHDEVDQDRKVKGKYLEELNPIQSILLAAAGPIANFILSIVGIAALYTFHGRNYTEIEIRQSAGLLEEGDRITQLNNTRLVKLLENRLFVDRGLAEIKRNEENLVVQIDSIDRKASKFSNSTLERLAPGAALWVAIQDVTFLIKSYFLKLVYLGRNVSKLGGPVAVIKDGLNFTGDFHTFLKWLFIISILIGTFNLLPIPPLDGGKILLGVLELCTPKAWHGVIRKVFLDVALVVVLTLFTLTFKNDIIGFKK